LAGSEAKSIEKLCRSVNYFPPGCCATVPINNARLVDIKQYYSLPTIPDRRLSVHNTQTAVRQTLIQAVKKRLMADRRFGFMLSGGLDSSLIASIATKFLNPNAPKPVAFSVGFIDSPI
jgi:asparagine synthase (glutamine-hydrolysing)